MTKQTKTVTELEAELKVARENTEVEQLRKQGNQDRATITALEKRLRRADFQVLHTGKLMKAVKDAINNKQFGEELARFEAEQAGG